MARGLEGVERLMRRFEAMPDKVRAATRDAVQKGAAEMVAEMIAIAPRDNDPNNGEQVREHIRWEVGRLGDVSAVVIADAKDAKGRPKASRVELGHMAEDGTEVPASPFFYPVVRLRRKRVRSRITREMRKAIRS